MHPTPKPSAPVSRPTGPRTKPLTVAQWTAYQHILTNTHNTLGTLEWDSHQAQQTGVFNTILQGLTGHDAEKVFLRAMTGIPINGLMLTAGHKPRTWRTVTAAHPRRSHQFDTLMDDLYAHNGFDHITLRTHLNNTPLHHLTTAGVDHDITVAAWEQWAQTRHCTCGQTNATHIDPNRTATRWHTTRRACRPHNTRTEPFINELIYRYDYGTPIYATNLTADHVNVTTINADPTNNRSVGKALAKLADQQPPAQPDQPFLVRLGMGTNNKTAFSVVDWNMPLRLQPDIARHDPNAPTNAEYTWT